MNLTGELRTNRRRAVGSIIGGAFLLLILFSGYAFYLLSNRTVNEFNNVLSDMRKIDVDRTQEHMSLLTVTKTVSGFTIHVINDGPNPVKITHTGYRDILDPSTPYTYDSTTLTTGGELLNPQDSTNIDINLDPTSPAYDLVLVSDRGKIYNSEYPVKSPPGGEESFIQEEISDVIGKFLPTYLSFQWTTRPPVKNQYQTIINKWNGNWGVQVISKDKLAFRIKLTWMGKWTVTLGKYTAIYCNRMDKTQGQGHTLQAYIVSYNEITHKISLYDGTMSFTPGSTHTVYFASDASAQNMDLIDPADGGVNFPDINFPFFATIGIYDDAKTYSQTIPFVALFPMESAQPNYSVTFSNSPIGWGDVIYDELGTTPNPASLSLGNHYISANPGSGYEFSNWDATGDIFIQNIEKSNTIVTIKGSGTITANYKLATTTP